MQRVRRIAVAGLVALLAVAGGVSGAVAEPQQSPQTSQQTSPRGQQDQQGPVVKTAEPAAQGKPNILMVVTDDMRYDDLRFMPAVREHIRDRGIDWRNSFVPTALCCPSRASFLTGRYAHNHEVYSHVLPYGYGAFDDSRTLATAMQDAGYHTGFVGKYLNGYGPAPSKVAGTEHSYTYVPNGWDDWRGSPDSTPYADPDPRAGGTYAFFDMTLNINGLLVGNEGDYSTNLIGRHTRDMIDRGEQSRKPWFMLVNPVAPHKGGPREVDDPGPVWSPRGWGATPTPARPDWVKGRYDHVKRAPGIRRDGSTERDVSDKAAGTRQMIPLERKERRRVTMATRQRAESLYVVDRQFARTVRHLKSIGEYRNTIMVFTSDNGFMLGEHRHRVGKNVAYDESARVPLVMAGPGIPRGVRRFHPATNMSLTATILKWAGASMPNDAQALQPSFLFDRPWDKVMGYEALQGGMRRDPKLSNAFPDARNVIGVRTARYSLVRYANGDSELFDRKKDPLELHAIGNDRSYLRVRRAMRKLWWSYRDCQGRGCVIRVPRFLRANASQIRELGLARDRARNRYYGG